MNCWFCNEPMKDGQPHCDKMIESFSETGESLPFKVASSCRNHYVTYVYNERHTPEAKNFILFKVQLIGTIWNWNWDKEPRKYIIDYFLEDRGNFMYITEEIDLPRDPEDESPYIKREWKRVLKLPFTEPIITPINFKDKLPFILTFS